MDNMSIYNRVRTPPDSAIKTIQTGRLKGKSDISPMWRIKALTEVFGPCGSGWNTINEKYSIIPVEATQEVICIYELDLIYMTESGGWSDPVHGVGGNMLVSKEKSGLHANDEGIKMAKTDALSVAAKALGFAADVYWNADRTKYTKDTEAAAKTPPESTPMPENGIVSEVAVYLCADCSCEIGTVTKKSGDVMSAGEVAAQTNAKYGRMLCPACWADEKARVKASEDAS